VNEESEENKKKEGIKKKDSKTPRKDKEVEEGETIKRKKTKTPRKVKEVEEEEERKTKKKTKTPRKEKELEDFEGGKKKKGKGKKTPRKNVEVNEESEENKKKERIKKKDSKTPRKEKEVEEKEEIEKKKKTKTPRQEKEVEDFEGETKKKGKGEKTPRKEKEMENFEGETKKKEKGKKTPREEKSEDEKPKKKKKTTKPEASQKRKVSKTPTKSDEKMDKGMAKKKGKVGKSKKPKKGAKKSQKRKKSVTKGKGKKKGKKKLMVDLSEQEPINMYGFQLSESRLFELEIEQDYSRKMKKDKKTWEKLSENEIQKNSEILGLVKEHMIPDKLRGKVWNILSGGKDLSLQKKHVGYYEKSLEEVLSMELNKTTTQINADLHRTFVNHKDFKPGAKQIERLKNLLYTYSYRNPVIGYAQGNNFIAGIILIMTKDESEAFWTYTALIEQILPPDFYDDSLFGMVVFQEVLMKLMVSLNTFEKIKEKFVGFDFLDSYFPLVMREWLATLFIDLLPSMVYMRVLDLVFSYGSSILLRTCLAIVLMFEDDILATKSSDSLFLEMKHLPQRVMYPDKLIEAIFNVPDFPNDKKLNKLTKSARKDAKKQAKATLKRRKKMSKSKVK